MRKRKILLVTNSLHPQVGGAEINVGLQARELAGSFEVEVATPRRAYDPVDERVMGVRVRRLWNAHNPTDRAPSLGARAFCPELANMIVGGDYDLIHCFPSVNPNNQLALVLGAARRIPTFLSAFELFDYAYHLEALGLPLDKIAELSPSRREATFLSRYKAVFTTSRRETEVVARYSRRAVLSLVPVDLAEHDEPADPAGFRARYGIAPHERVLLCLGRVSFVRGQDILLRALPRLFATFGRARVVIVGRADHEPAFLARMHRFIEEHGLQRDVIFTGTLPRRHVLDALAACDAHVIPARFMSSGAAVVETWASRRPVIQSDRVDPSYVEEGKNGVTFEPGCEVDLAAKIARVLGNPGLRRAMGEAGRALVERRFQYKNLVDLYMRDYEAALSGCSPIGERRRHAAEERGAERRAAPMRSIAA